MKKSTKIITTAVALVLVMGFMVVGILAATAASATITASVNWTAEAGIWIEIEGGVWLSKEHYEENGKSLPTDEEVLSMSLYDMVNYGQKGFGPEFDKIDIDTTTTNAQATGMQRTLNANFCDDTDDGVNNPRSIYYWYLVKNNKCPAYGGGDWDSYDPLNVAITKIPETTSAVKVQYLFWDGMGAYSEGPGLSLGFSDVKPTKMIDHREAHPPVLVIKLTLINPDQSLSNFDAGVGFSITKTK